MDVHVTIHNSHACTLKAIAYHSDRPTHVLIATGKVRSLAQPVYVVVNSIGSRVVKRSQITVCAVLATIEGALLLAV
jgi:hypothetical protein